MSAELRPRSRSPDVSTAHKLLTLLSCLLADSLCNSSACGGSLRRDFVGLALALGADGVLMRVTPEPFEPSLHSPRRASCQQCESSSIGSSIESISKRSYNSSSAEPNQGRQTRLQQGETAATQDTVAEWDHRQGHTVKVDQDVGALGL